MGTIEEMVTAFLSAEDRNFALITMINDLNREIEGLEVECNALRKEIEATRATGHSAETARARVLEELDATIEALQAKAEAFSLAHEATVEAIEAMKPALASLFAKVGANEGALNETLAAQGVSDANLAAFLGAIELRVAEIIQLYALVVKGSGRVPEEMRGLLTPARPDKMHATRVGGVGEPDGATKARRVVDAIPLPPSTHDAAEEDAGEEGRVLVAVAKPVSIAQLRSQVALRDAPNANRPE